MTNKPIKAIINEIVKKEIKAFNLSDTPKTFPRIIFYLKTNANLSGFSYKMITNREFNNFKVIPSQLFQALLAKHF